MATVPNLIKKKMIKILEESKGNIVATKATGKLTAANYRKLLPFLNQKEREFLKIRWYFEMDNFDSWTPKAGWEDLKFDMKHADQMEKIALVGGKKWEELLTGLMKPFTTAEVKFYDLEQKEHATEWIKS